MKKGSLLLERSQVLKGETVPAQEVWEGRSFARLYRGERPQAYAQSCVR